MPVVVHVSPHPDDEALGAPATLLLLRRAGWDVVNLVASLGRPGQHARRRDEALHGAGRAGFELVLPDERALGDRIASLLREREPSVVVSPWPHDGHPSHEAAASATADALASSGSAGVVAMGPLDRSPVPDPLRAVRRRRAHRRTTRARGVLRRAGAQRLL